MERNTFVTATRTICLQNGCHCKGLEDLFVVLFQGAVTLRHYVVMYDTTNMNTDRVQQLTYKLRTPLVRHIKV